MELNKEDDMNCNRCNDMLINAEEYESNMCFACQVDLLDAKRDAITFNPYKVIELDNQIDAIHEILGWL